MWHYGLGKTQIGYLTVLELFQGQTTWCRPWQGSATIHIALFSALWNLLYKYSSYAMLSSLPWNTLQSRFLKTKETCAIENELSTLRKLKKRSPLFFVEKTIDKIKWQRSVNRGSYGKAWFPKHGSTCEYFWGLRKIINQLNFPISTFCFYYHPNPSNSANAWRHWLSQSFSNK